MAFCHTSPDELSMTTSHHTQTFDNCSHAYCNAHHLRELQFITDQYQQPWAEKMSQLLLAIVGRLQKTSQQSSALTPEQIAHFQHRYDVFIKEGYAANLPPPPSLSKRRGRRKQSPPKNLLDRLDKPQNRKSSASCMTLPFLLTTIRPSGIFG